MSGFHDLPTTPASVTTIGGKSVAEGMARGDTSDVIRTLGAYGSQLAAEVSAITATVGPLAPVTGPAPAGFYDPPANWVDTIGGTITSYNGTRWGPTQSRFSAVDDFSQLSTTTQLYVDYAAGSDANTGLSFAQAKKHLYAAVGLVMAGAAGSAWVINMVDTWVGSDSFTRSGGGTEFDGRKTLIRPYLATGRVRFQGTSELYNTAAFAFAQTGKSWFSSTATGKIGWRSAFDARYTDQQGLPRPLTLAASHVAAAATDNSFYSDGTGLTVRLQDGRLPSLSDGFILNGSTITFPFGLDSGTLLFDRLDFTSHAGTNNFNVRVQPVNATTFVSTAKIGWRDCHFYGSGGDACQVYDLPVAVHENTLTAYNARDGVSYSSYKHLILPKADARTCTFYEDNIKSYNNGTIQWGDARGTSDNASTAHDAWNGFRWLSEGYETWGSNFADVGGTSIVSYGIKAGSTGGSAYPWNFWFESTQTSGVPALPRLPRAIYIGAEATAKTGEITFRNTSVDGASQDVAYWRGPSNAPVSGLIKNFLTGAALSS